MPRFEEGVVAERDREADEEERGAEEIGVRGLALREPVLLLLLLFGC
jgi:hypothetical protein